MAAALTPIKVDSKTDELIAHVAHFLGSSKKDIVDVAVREYIENHRDEIQKAALDALRTLDGSTKSAVQLLTGASAEEFDELTQRGSGAKHLLDRLTAEASSSGLYDTAKADYEAALNATKKRSQG